MKRKIFKANLAILDPMAKTICCFGMRIGRYGWESEPSRLKIQKIKIQAYSTKKQNKIMLEACRMFVSTS